ncbi:MAG: inositol monophosphatase family protein, partial [Candidatus Aenigmatarchaeota archaeon]
MDYQKLCEQAALAGGKAILNHTPGHLVQKADKYVGTHAIVTDADFLSQKSILNELVKDKDAFFITEEIVKGVIAKRIIKSADINKMKNSRVYIVDELDGTSSFNAGHYEWSISVGCTEKLQHIAGAVFAPKLDMLFGAAKGIGSFLKNGGKQKQIHVNNNILKDAYVIFGPDNFLTKYPAHNKLLTKLGDATRTINGNGSCALPLGLVACGKADALIEPLQSPWDWAAGKLLVEEAGGVLLFYEMDKGQ